MTTMIPSTARAARLCPRMRSPWTTICPDGKNVDADEAADAGFEIQDEDNVFGLLNDSYTTDSDDDSENE